MRSDPVSEVVTQNLEAERITTFMMQMDFDLAGDKLREECGVFGIYDFDGNDVSSTIITAFLPFSTEDRRAAASR